MSIEAIDEPYRTEITKILSTNDTLENKQLALKLYLIGEPYFKHFASEPSYLTRSIINTFNSSEL
jgi:hypothetical protein